MQVSCHRGGSKNKISLQEERKGGARMTSKGNSGMRCVSSTTPDLLLSFILLGHPLTSAKSPNCRKLVITSIKHFCTAAPLLLLWSSWLLLLLSRFILMVQRTFVGTLHAIRYFIYKMENQKKWWRRAQEFLLYSKWILDLIWLCPTHLDDWYDYWNCVLLLQHCNLPPPPLLLSSRYGE